MSSASWAEKLAVRSAHTVSHTLFLIHIFMKLHPQSPILLPELTEPTLILPSRVQKTHPKLFSWILWLKIFRVWEKKKKKNNSSIFTHKSCIFFIDLFTFNFCSCFFPVLFFPSEAKMKRNMNIYAPQLSPSLHQVWLPGAPPQLHLLFGASGSSPRLLSLPGVATGKAFFCILIKAIHTVNNIHYSGLVCDHALFVFP